ncbi:hypothetical protein [Methylorubrum extorquens]|uniref:Uncharacterized protein n=1 Tax=Methylorubrum extorquens (strain CM4 / NCIMB 13688) TaxID=440085 RepID=B7KSY6_METC4|nr:hypothetical protein [Methylorubrum extorquens]ACK82488.1 hypothetical protein Mchl_1624 [Methylorubrum extorquens CM4]
MSHRSLRLCAILGAAGLALTTCALALAASTVWDAAHRGDLPVLHLGSAER